MRCVFLGQLLLHCENTEPSFSFPSLEASLRTQGPLLPAFHLHSFLLALSRKHFVSLRVRTHFLILSRDQELGSKGPYVIGFVSCFSRETSWYMSGGLLILFRMSSLPLPPPCHQFSPVGANSLSSSLFPTITHCCSMPIGEQQPLRRLREACVWLSLLLSSVDLTPLRCCPGCWSPPSFPPVLFSP